MCQKAKSQKKNRKKSHKNHIVFKKSRKTTVYRQTLLLVNTSPNTKTLSATPQGGKSSAEHQNAAEALESFFNPYLLTSDKIACFATLSCMARRAC